MHPKNMDFVMVITTCSSQEEAERLASVLVAERLAACAQVSGPIASVYWWKGDLEKDMEWQVKFKMPSKNFQKACDTIKQNHSYEVPQIVSVRIDGVLPEYADWLIKETK